MKRGLAIATGIGSILDVYGTGRASVIAHVPSGKIATPLTSGHERDAAAIHGDWLAIGRYLADSMKVVKTTCAPEVQKQLP